MRLVFNIRFNDLLDAADAERRDRAARRRRGERRARTTLTFDPTNAVAFLTPRGAFTDLVARAIEDVTGGGPNSRPSGGTSDARFIKDACPVVELGLVGATMHAVDERVPVDDLETLSRVYERALELYFAGASG